MTALSPSRYWLRLGGCAVFLLLLVLLSPGVGTESSRFGWRDAWRARLGIVISASELVDRGGADLDGDGTVSESERDVFAQTARMIFDQRMPRTLLALQVGITLALCGATFQILFRNSLATPYTLGVASGGSLGAMIAIKIGWIVSLGGISSLAVSAFAGAVLVVGIVMLIASGVRRLTSNELLLAGVTMGLFCSAMMMLVTSVSSQRQTFAMVRWMMGSLDAVEMVAGTRLLPLMLPAWVAVVVLSRALNQYRLGDELATMRGVSIRRVQVICVGACTLAVAAAVGQCGPIGFVGLVVPHMARLLVGSDCRVLLPVSALLGGAFLILCDWGSQVTMRIAGWVSGQQLGSATLPIGVVTAIVGVPLFLILLRAWRR